MLTILIWSVDQKLLKNLKKNIAKTIGDMIYEILDFDNSASNTSIARDNNGLRKAQFPYILYLHEDIYFHSMDWGRLLVRNFEKTWTRINRYSWI